MIIDHDDEQYRRKWRGAGANKFNGAFFYSKEIRKNIIPRINTDYSWILINTHGLYGRKCDHAIVFCHNNKSPENYLWLQDCKDIILVCGLKSTAKKMQALMPQHKAIYLPLSIDVKDVKKYACEKDKDTAFVGRPVKKTYGVLPGNIDYLENLPRTRLLREMARYKKVYAVGRCAIEAKALGCEVLPYDSRFPDPNIWQVLDNRDAAKILQHELDKLNGSRTKSEKGEDDGE